MNTHGIFFQPPVLARDYPSHVQWSGPNRLLSPPECAAVIGYGALVGWQPGTIGNDQANRHVPTYRSVEVATLSYMPALDWLYERLTSKAQFVNDEYYHFDLAGLLEPLQLLRYTAAEGQMAGHYDLHQDFGSGYLGRRKLSVVIQLTEGTEYDGCDLTLISHRPEQMPYRQAGDGVIFPSWTPHSVSHITRGVRHALVAWIHGTPFR